MREPISTGDHSLAAWRDAEWWTAGATVALALVTLILAIYTYRLWRAAREGAQAQAESTREALQVAQRSADAAVTSSEALLAAERAYLFVEVVQNTVTIDDSFPRQVSVKIWNHGRTPAELTRIRSYMSVSETVPQELLATEDSEQELPAGVGLPPRTALDLTLEVRFNDGQLFQVSTLTKAMYCIGRIEYRDMFGQARATGFCWRFVQSATQQEFVPVRDSKLNSRS